MTNLLTDRSGVDRPARRGRNAGDTLADMAETVTIRTPAKVNLALSVGPPEPAGTPDAGMHPIASWIAAVDLFDDITLTKADATTLERHWADDARADRPWAGSPATT